MNTGNEQRTGGERGDNILVAEYVLGVLSAEEHTRVAELIARDPALQQSELFWQSRLSSLDENFDEVPAPARTWGRIEDRLFGTTAQTGPLPSFWNSLNLWRGLAAGGLAVAVVALGFSYLQPLTTAPGEPAAQLVATLQADDSDVTYLALYDSQAGTVRLTGLSGEPVSGRDYELWVIQPDEAPVSLGVIPISGRSEAVLPEDQRARMGEGSVFAVSLEPQGGAPAGVPTGPIVAAGAVTNI